MSLASQPVSETAPSASRKVPRSPANNSLSEAEFGKFRDLIYAKAGIYLSPAKRSLVAGRLGKRVRHYGLASFGEYYALATVKGAHEELQTLVDLLTTNETYFFREPKHFEFLRSVAERAKGRGPFRVWSAAASSGEEAYSAAMCLASVLGSTADWTVLGTDVSSRVLERARRGHYALPCAKRIPEPHLREYCLKGVRDQEGTFLIDPAIRRKVEFRQMNLNGTWNELPQFDVIFLRNVMIYFDQQTKRRLVDRLHGKLKPGGRLVIGHSETLNAVSDRFEVIRPSMYRRKG